MKLALFGGTFDPIHSGHVEAAIAAAEAHALDRVLVVPSGLPPHKTAACRASYECRYRMVELACGADPRLEASRLEAPRPDGEPHYSIDTIRKVYAEREFEPPLHFVIGADAFAEVDLWRDTDLVAAMVEFLVVERPGTDMPTLQGIISPRGRFVRCRHPASSRTVRHRVKIGGSLADLVPAAVCEYIWEHGLYSP